MKIEIYGRPNCQWCTAAQNYLKRKGWEFSYHNLMAMEPNKSLDIINGSGMKTVPIVKVDNIYIGGYDQLEAYIQGVEQRAM